MSFEVQESCFSLALVLIRNGLHKQREARNCINEQLNEELGEEEIGLN